MAAPTPIRIPARKRRRRSPYRRVVWLLPAAAAAAVVWFIVRPAPPGPKLPAGYVDSTETLGQEYRRFQGKALRDPDVKRQFTRAANLATAGDFAGAAALLESLARQAPLPVVFNDLGVVYARLRDRSRTINAFRDALALDVNCRPARSNMDRLTQFMADSAEPVTREVEPNGADLLANVIALGGSVEAEIVDAQSDVDVFRFRAPPPPRDVLALEIDNRSATLQPSATFYDSDLRLLDWKQVVRQPGAPLAFHFSPEPNMTLYLHAAGNAGSGGRYILTVRPLRAFDAFEPNDTVLQAQRIAFGETVEANIMDKRDTDFYSLVSPRTGTISVQIHNRSDTLIPALSTLAPDMRASGFGPDLRTPGADLSHTMAVEANRVYFIQVWPQAESAGNYSLIVK